MTGSHPVVRLLVALAVLVGLGILGAGLVKNFQFERTPDAVAAIRTGGYLVLLGCVLLTACAVAAAMIGSWWAGAAIAAPALVCGALMAAAADTLLPQLAALPTFALALVGAAAVALHHG
ncbi:hypothetical protein IOD16_18580 [Saccharothrix sp. 6-C]|uniref:hypothetical protein n=1 Tax=Saccharothrix sp. 6-C TaxID=2781735 RepID=UPI001917703A|nr:hypothetical protein [Saccharothrix sp. 6-C]QQQ80210.1 hypothetical protein IOD16_18580 [Saccharothrix sp. 6-C]